MALVRYELVADPGISITKLVFEHVVFADILKKSDTLPVTITGRLDIDFECKGGPLAHPGNSWKLFVWVDGSPIQTSDFTGGVSGHLDKNKKGGFINSYNF